MNFTTVDSWVESLYRSKALELGTVTEDSEFVLPEPEPDRNLASEFTGCEEWLEREDAVLYSRDFNKDPILVSGGEKEGVHCSVGCKFGSTPGKKPDAGFGELQQDGTAAVLLSMESSHYCEQNNIARARWSGYNIVMTTSLSSDVPVGYFSWVEYDIMAPVQPKTEKSLAAAFISNCEARNFRLQVLEALENANVEIDSYGGCHNNRDGRVDKVKTLKRYKFSLAFENSNEEDYVTEKFFQSLIAGTIPVVVGAPNIQDFAPCPGSILHIKELSDVASVARTMQHLNRDPIAFNQPLSDSGERRKERPCKCTKGSHTVYHLYVRERGRFEMQSIFLRSRSITLAALESSKFKSLNHKPIWKAERPETIRGGDELKIHRICPVGMTQRQALYTFRFKGNDDLKTHIERKPCAAILV